MRPRARARGNAAPMSPAPPLRVITPKSTPHLSWNSPIRPGADGNDSGSPCHCRWEIALARGRRSWCRRNRRRNPLRLRDQCAGLSHESIQGCLVCRAQRAAAGSDLLLQGGDVRVKRDNPGRNARQGGANSRQIGGLLGCKLLNRIVDSAHFVVVSFGLGAAVEIASACLRTAPLCRNSAARSCWSCGVR